MNNKNGFTLIEMLGTIVVLLVLLIVFTPSIEKVLRDSNKLSKDYSEEYVLDAARIYAGEINKEITHNLKNETDYEIITLDTLENLGLIQEDDILRLGPTARIKITLEDYSRLKYEIVYDDSLVMNNNPYTVLFGNTIFYLNQGNTYNEAGWIAFDEEGKIITNNVVVTGTVNQNVIGTYVLTYTLLDEEENVVETKTREVIVVDSTAPTVTVATITSNNPYNNKFVKNSETVTLSMTFSKDVTDPIVTIGGRTATVTGSGATRTATYTIPVEETSLVSKALEISISDYSDIHDNKGITATNVSGGGLVVYDNIKPVIVNSTITSNNTNNKVANNGDTVTMSTTFSEPTIGVISKIGGRTAVVTGENTNISNGTYTIPIDEGTLTEGNIVGEITQYMDRAGNIGESNNIKLLGDTVAYSAGEPVEEGPFVQDVVAIGDYIDYDAGNWSSTVALPTVQGTFGGYTSGNSKNQGLACESAAAAVSGRYGWRVFNINSTTGEVSLIHVGTPECYYTNNNAAASVTILTTRDYSYYVNSTFASSATIFTKAMGEALYGSAFVYGGGFYDDDIYITEQLLLSGSRYYFPDVYNTSYLYYVQPGGYFGATRYNAYGIRPVIKLKTNIYISSGDGTSGNKYILSTTK